VDFEHPKLFRGLSICPNQRLEKRETARKEEKSARRIICGKALNHCFEGNETSVPRNTT
jgi:hypothetical protein